MREIATIILLTKNGDKWLNGVLESIFHQNNSNQFHVIALDSNSTDNTLDILSKHPVKITSLDESNFHHTKTRNLAVKMSNTPYVVFLTQDAQPADKDWFRNLILPLIEDREVAGVFSRQIPYKDCIPTEERDLLTHFGTKKRITEVNIKNKKAYTKYLKKKQKYIQFSNVSSAFRKSVIAKMKFNEDIFLCEDQEWCKRALEQGYKIIYQPESKVYHSHNFSVKKTYKRYKEFGRAYKDFLKLDNSFLKVIACIFFETFKDYIFLMRSDRYDLFQKIFWIIKIPFLRGAMYFGNYNGYSEKNRYLC